ncbi:hypothetical protein RM550_01565 [Streptomyces sp. DSM 41527]|uniref:Uncharacterized protein n=1 Tax=Streptomyces mooreae TaxID=3075523 RepID=A0ABU2SZK6_9ACTN|nr:hypothetical protein [Streptomyces sp. DSM 41527]MDT0454427.1 hypothetical protein [Streptomyces sp. DSM 41527]
MTTPETTLLLPYRLDASTGPAAPSDDNATPLYGRLRLTVGDDPQGRMDRPVRCTRITLGVPSPAARPGLARPPLALTTAAPTVHERAHGREWWIVPNTTDPAVTVFTCLPEEPAHFDGTWSISFVIDMDPGFESTTVEITEETTAGSGDVTARTSPVPLTVLPSAH